MAIRDPSKSTPEDQPLTGKQMNFVNAYVANSFNAVKAAAEAGYSFPSQQGWQVKELPHVKAEIRRRTAAAAMSADEVLSEIGAIARANLGDYLDIGEWGTTVNLNKAKKAGVPISLVRSYANGKATGVKIELHDKLGALNTLARVHGLLDKKQAELELGEDGSTPALQINVTFKEKPLPVDEAAKGAADDPGE